MKKLTRKFASEIIKRKNRQKTKISDVIAIIVAIGISIVFVVCLSFICSLMPGGLVTMLLAVMVKLEILKLSNSIIWMPFICQFITMLIVFTFSLILAIESIKNKI